MHVVESVAALASEIADIGNIKFQFGDYSTPVRGKLICCHVIPNPVIDVLLTLLTRKVDIISLPVLLVQDRQTQ